MNTELKVSNQLRGFARRLVAEGLIEEQAALDACENAGRKGRTVLAWLIAQKGLDPEVLAAAASVEYGVPLADPRAMDLAQAPISLGMPSTWRNRSNAARSRAASTHPTQPSGTSRKLA